MLNLRKYPPNHCYSDALFTLLYEHPDGLSAVDISYKLRISDAECKKLLHDEEIREAIVIDLDYDAGTSLYKTTMKTHPLHSLEEEIHRAKELSQSPIRLTLKVITILCCLILVCVSIFYLSSPHPALEPTVISKDTSEQYAQDVLAARNIAEQKEKRKGLIERVEAMKLDASKAKCDELWNNRELCYIKGRLLSKAAFDHELVEMRLEISSLDELLNFVGL
jgi:hypothetical protein